MYHEAVSASDYQNERRYGIIQDKIQREKSPIERRKEAAKDLWQRRTILYNIPTTKLEEWHRLTGWRHFHFGCEWFPVRVWKAQLEKLARWTNRRNAGRTVFGTGECGLIQ